LARFQTTRWSLVLSARSDDAVAADALAELCRSYRTAVLAYFRRSGYQAQDADDLTQGFFLKFLEKRYDIGADRSRGRFRSYLLSALQGYLANQRDAAHALKRGGGLRIESLDVTNAGAELHDAAPTPEREFEREYALSMVSVALARLRDEAEAAGRGAQYARLAIYVVDPPAPGEFRALSQRLGISANTLSVQVRRMRQRLLELLRLELAQTVSDSADVDAEMQALRAALMA
jgi:RNA polymerase sigma factor (sigma-70 family)